MQEVKIQSTVRNAHQTFTVPLGGFVFNFEMDWSTRFEEWGVMIQIEGEPEPLVTKSILNPGMNLLEGIHGYGRFYCYGEQPTLSNLGVDAFLIWVSDNEIHK